MPQRRLPTVHSAILWRARPIQRSALVTTALTAGVLAAVVPWLTRDALAVCAGAVDFECTGVTNADQQFTPGANGWTVTLVTPAEINGDGTGNAALDIDNGGDFNGTVTLEPNTAISGSGNPGILLQNAAPADSVVVFDIDGDVSSDTDDAIRIEDGFDIGINASAETEIAGGEDGIDIDFWSGTFTVVNKGLVDGQSGDGIQGGVGFIPAGSVDITNTNEITGSANGISMQSVADFRLVNDDSLISGQTFNGVVVDSVGPIDISNVGGEITGGAGGVQLFSVGGNLAIDNTGNGLIDGTTADGIDVFTVNNGAAGKVRIDNFGTAGLGTDAGSILGGANGVQIQEIMSTNSLVIDNSFGGTIEGETEDGIDIFFGTFAGAKAELVIFNGGDADTDGGLITGGQTGVSIEDIKAVNLVSIDNGFGGAIEGGSAFGVAIRDIMLVGAGAAVQVLNNGDADTAGGEITGGVIGVGIQDITGSELVFVDNSFGGRITGETGDGIVVRDADGEVLILNEDGGTVDGDVDGIHVEVAGDIGVGSKGGLVTAETAIGMILHSSAGDIAVEAGDVTAQGDGINADAKAGEIGVVVFGDILSKTGDGVEALSQGTGPVTVGVAAGGSIEAAQSAIEIEVQGSDGKAKATVEVDGEIEGGATGLADATILSDTVDGTGIEVGADGMVTGDGGAADALIVNVVGGAAVMDNFGTMVGRLDLTGENDLFRNWSEDSWITSGTTDFGAGVDQLDNAGRIEIVDVADFVDLELFNNFAAGDPADTGILDMADGDVTEILTTDGDYDGGDGSLFELDAVLDVDPADGPGDGDFFAIGGNADGVTLVSVDNADPDGIGGYDPVGIHIVGIDGASNADAFQLAGGSISVGFFSYDIEYEPVGINGFAEEFWLRSDINDQGQEPPKLITGAQALFHQSNQTWLDRTADLRIFTNPGVGTMDAAVNRAESGYTDGSPGVWVRGWGAWLERDAEGGGYDQDMWGAQVGIDFPLTRPNAESGTFILGALAGYASSQQDFDGTGSEAEIDGPEVGVYGTYLQGGFFADLLVKAQFLELDYEAHDPDDGASADVLSIGAVADTGYRFDFDGFFLEPQATLAYVHTDIDDLEVLQTEVAFDEDDSWRGRLGVRGGTRFQATSAFMVEPFVGVSVWHEFAGDNAAVLTSSGMDFGVSDDAGDTWVEVGAGVNLVDFGSGVSGFVKADYRFAGDTDGVDAQAGVRVNF